MKYTVDFSNGAKTNFTIQEVDGIFICELFTGRLIANQNSLVNSYISSFNLEIIKITEKSLDLVLKKTNEEIQKRKEPSLSFTIKLIDN